MTNAPFMIAIAVVAIALTATPTLAFGPGGDRYGPKMNFQQIDSDGDGQITPDELQGRTTARFGEADTDGNGLLSAAEIQAQGQKHMARRIASMIERFDKDDDGALSQDEMPGPRGTGRMFAHFDSDGSGGISEQEFNEAREDMRSHRKGRWGKRWNKN